MCVCCIPMLAEAENVCMLCVAALDARMFKTSFKGEDFSPVKVILHRCLCSLGVQPGHFTVYQLTCLHFLILISNVFSFILVFPKQ